LQEKCLADKVSPHGYNAAEIRFISGNSRDTYNCSFSTPHKTNHMQGKVHSMNPRRGMVAIETRGHGFTIIELLTDSNIEIGDVMEWSHDTGCGHQDYTNLTKQRTMRVYAQNYWVNPPQLRQQLLFTD